MAKSSRASSRKANNQKLKKTVFGPIESARAQRLSEKLLEIAAQPKSKPPEKANEMEGVIEEATVESVPAKSAPGTRDIESMDIDSGAKPAIKRSPTKRGIEKRRHKKSSIVFPKYSDRKVAKKRK